MNLVNKLVGGAEFYPYQIDQSCRFNDDDSANLTWVPGPTSTDGKKKTISTLVKRGNISTLQGIFGAYYNASNLEYIAFNSSNKLDWYCYLGGTIIRRLSTQVFRDVGNWYHFVFVQDTSKGTAADRIKIYCNSIEITAFDTQANPILNSTSPYLFKSDGVVSKVGLYNTAYFDGYQAEVYFIDGQALTPSSFGEFKSDIWVPKKYTGSYGTNGFYLDFADSADLGNDVSGNNNDFTSSGLAANDQVLDSPTNNYPTLNVLHHLSTATLANGNLDCSGAENEYASIIIPHTGKWGWEITVSENGSFGLEDVDANEEVDADVSGEVVEMLVDMDAGTLKKKVDGGGLETIEASLNTSSEWYPYFKAACSVDFGQMGYTPTESGYKALCSVNLSKPTVLDSSKGFDVVTYEGTGAEKVITDLEFQPDLVWIKNRDAVDQHVLTDSVRGVTKELNSDSTAIETTVVQGLKSFGSSGFTLGTDDRYNTNAESFVAWCFRMGVKYGFDIQTYEGTGSAHAENHDLGGVPELMIVKNLGNAQHWGIYHHHALNKTDPETDRGVLNLNVAWLDDAAFWNDTAPTSAQFTVGTSASTNHNTFDHVAYLWRSIPQFSKVFSYEGNGNADGPFVYCGFRPRYVMLKKANAAGSWILHDTTRNTYNPVGKRLLADGTNAESDDAFIIDILSNGFKIRNNNSDWNTSAGLYVGIAYAELPGKYSNAR